MKRGIYAKNVFNTFSSCRYSSCIHCFHIGKHDNDDSLNANKLHIFGKGCYMKQHTLHDIFLQEIKDVYDAEQQIITALPSMISAASDEELTTLLQEHLEETEEQVTRLEELATNLGYDLSGVSCKGMSGIIAEGKKMLEMNVSDEIKDALIISAAMKVEHYEMSTYMTLVTLAGVLDYSIAEDLLTSNLEEEEAAAEALQGLAEGGLFSKGLTEKAAESEMDTEDENE